MFGLLEETEVPQENTQTQEKQANSTQIQAHDGQFSALFYNVNVIKTTCLVEKYICRLNNN